MAQLQKFLIAPPKSGQQTNMKPFLIADDAYEELRNMLVWRGRVKKRFGARTMDQSVPDSQQQQFTRLRLAVDTTDAGGNAASVVPGSVYKIGQMFSIGLDFYTVVALGNPGVMLSTSGTATVFTYDTTTGAFVFANAAALQSVFFYPSEPVMNFWLYNQIDINDERTIAFDTQFSYEYNTGSGWSRSGGMPGLWSGTNSDFYWAANWFGATSDTYTMFVVNNRAIDGIQYFDGTDWNLLPPPILDAAGNTLQTALITVVFKERLLFLNTTELIGITSTTFTNRVRFSQVGSPLTVDAFNTSIVGKGGFVEFPTKEAIISVEFLKDRLIVFLESSTWELVYTGNQVFPFDVQKINTELGVESTHSIIPFDKVVLGMGGTGIHACNGLNVQRIDQDIPSTIFDISNINHGPQRVQGIRDYFEELSYWTYPSTDESYRSDNVFPNRVLVFDYINGTWAFNDDSITAFGYFYLQDDFLVWQNITNTWEVMTQTWDDGESNNLFRSVIAGNQEGWTFIVTPDLTRNCMSLQITNFVQGLNAVTLTIIDHNLRNESYIFIDNIDSLNGIISSAYNGTIQQITYIDENNVSFITSFVGADTYRGEGTVERVSEIEIKTKEYNFFPNEGKWVYIPYVDFYVDRTDNGQVLVEYLSSSSFVPVAAAANTSGALLGTSILETSPYLLKPYEETQDRFWHRVYFQMDGEVVQLFIRMNDDQLRDPQIVFSEFTINAVLYYAQPTQNYM